MNAVEQQPQQSHEQDIIPKNLQIDRSFFAFYGTRACHELLCVFGDFYASVTRGAEVTKSLQLRRFWAFFKILFGSDN